MDSADLAWRAALREVSIADLRRDVAADGPDEVLRQIGDRLHAG